MSEAQSVAIGRRLADSIDAMDPDQFKALFAEGGLHWNNVSKVAVTAEDRAAILAVERKHLLDVRFADQRLQGTADGFVLQGIVMGRTSTGNEVRIPVCFVGSVDDGGISRLDEYANVADLADLLQLLEAEGAR